MAEWERPSLSSGSAGPHFRKKKPRRLRRVLAAVVVVAVAGFGWIAWSAYREGRIAGNDGVVPLLHADSEPTRIRPDDPGGMSIPNRDKTIYNEIDPHAPPPKGVERLLPAPETPVARPTAAEPTIPTLGETAPPPAPREVGSVVTHTVTEPKPPAPAPQTAQPQPSPFHKVEAPPPPSKRKAETSKTASTAPSATAPKSRSSSSASGPRVQLAAVVSEAEARKEWERLLRANGDLLGSLSPTIVRADLGAKGVVYRVQAGPLASAAAASDLCGKLKARKVGCFVAR